MRRAALAVAAAFLLAGCGAEPYPPTGIDGLVIPMASPHQSGFARRIDNPWFPLTPGRTWRYRVLVNGRRPGRRTVTVERTPVEVEGVATTAVRDTIVNAGGKLTSLRVDYYAQDTAGNVWWFGQQGWWRAGADGAKPGLLMAAHPRLGDGYRSGYRPGTVEDVVTVAQLDLDQKAPSCVLETTSALEPGDDTYDTYVRGVGLTETLDPSADERDVLVR